MDELARGPRVSRAGVWRRRALWLAILVAGGIAATRLDASAALRAALDQIAALGPWGPPLFVLLYVIAAALFLPALILTLGAGFVFGLPRGIVIVSISATLAATVAFTVGRYLARDWVARTLSSHPGFRAVDEAVAREGWKIVLLTRLSPVFPFALLNYAFGLTKVRLGHYVLASWVGMLPATVVYVYLGSLAGALAGADGPSARTPAQWALYAVGLAATVAVTVYVTRLARRALYARAPIEVGASP